MRTLAVVCVSCLEEITLIDRDGTLELPDHDCKADEGRVA